MEGYQWAGFAVGCAIMFIGLYFLAPETTDDVPEVGRPSNLAVRFPSWRVALNASTHRRPQFRTAVVHSLQASEPEEVSERAGDPAPELVARSSRLTLPMIQIHRW